MINILGIVLFLTGFCLPYMVDTRLPSIYFFWLGGLLFFNKGTIISGKLRWAKWAQIGILIHIAAVVVMLITNLLIGYGSITRFEYWISIVLYWLSSPAIAIGQQLFPYLETHQPDGSVCFEISYYRTVITAFLDVAIFVLISEVIGLFWQKKKRKIISLHKIIRR